MSGQRISTETSARIAGAWPDVLARIAAGSLVRDALAAHDISADMKRAFLADNPEALRQWDLARENSADALYEEALIVAREPYEIVTKDKDGNALKEPLIVRRDPAHARTHIDTLKWAARIRNPRLYGDKAQLDVNVRTLDLTAIIRDANARLARSPGRVIEHDARARAAPMLGLEDLL